MKIRGLVYASALSALVFAGGCGPRASSVPLGLGPLAVAERDAELAAVEAKRKSGKPPPPARSRAAAAAPALVAKENASEASAKSEVDEASKPERGAGDDKNATAATPPAFEGLYAGDDIAVFRLTGFPDREQRDDKAKIRIEKSAPGNVSITLINSEDGSDLCQLSARVEGNAALLESAQPCFSDGGEGSLEAELTSGRAVLEGDRLKMDAEGTLSVVLPDQELDGELTYSFKGERQ
jgi:hypothetical protein